MKAIGCLLVFCRQKEIPMADAEVNNILAFLPLNTETRIGTGGGPGGGPTVDAETKNYLDAKMDSVRAQNDARFAEVLSRLDGIKDLPKFWPLVAAIAVASITIIGISVTILSYASDRFDGGLGASSLVDAITKDQAARHGAVQMLELRTVAGNLWQRVMITDTTGRTHLLDYQMIETADGWQTNAVQLLPAQDVGA